MLDARTGARRRILEEVRPWGIAPDRRGGVWLLPRLGGELIRYGPDGRLVERRTLEVRCQVLRTRGEVLLLARSAPGARGPLLWLDVNGEFRPWGGRVDPGSGDMESLVRRNAVVYAGNVDHTVVSRPFVGPVLEVLDRGGEVVSRITLPEIEEWQQDREQDLRACPLRDLAVVGKRIICLVGSRPGTESAHAWGRLLVLDLSGAVERHMEVPRGAARLAGDDPEQFFVVDERLGLHRIDLG